MELFSIPQLDIIRERIDLVREQREELLIMPRDVPDRHVQRRFFS